MKIINKNTQEVIAEITTNHSMSLDEALEFVADEILEKENPWDADYIINGKEIWYDDCDMVW